MATRSSLSSLHDDIVAQLGAGKNKTEIARSLGVARKTLSDYVDRNITAGEQLPVGRVEFSIPDGEVTRAERLQAELDGLKRRALRARTLDVQHELILNEIRTAIEACDVRFEPAKLAPPSNDGFSPHIQVALLSDTHGGEVVTPAGVDGLNEYNWAIMEERLANWRRSLLSFAANRPYPIQELQLWVLGDMCSGANHPEIVETNEYSSAEQGVRMGFVLGSLIESLVEHYPRIVVYGVVGNHPRLTVKPASKQVFNNFDWVAYKIAEERLAKYTTVECHFPTGGFAVAEVAGLDYLLFHGDGIRSTMPGVPWGGVVRRVNELTKSYQARGVLLDGFALGHFHQANAVRNIFMNGSVKGTDEYVLKHMGVSDPPEQLIVWFDADKKRRTDVSYINP